LTAGRVAVVTGAASGIGRAAALRFASFGMRICLADLPGPALEAAVAAACAAGAADVLAVPTDVSDAAQIQALCDKVYAQFGEVAVLMNNAGTGAAAGPYDGLATWHHVLGVNLWGVINGVQIFTPRMIAAGKPAAIINTGSKQGITCPPGNSAYNVSKAGVKTVTEALAHALRNEAPQISAHLLVPGSTQTGMTRGTPPGTWSPDQVIDLLIDSMNAGKFYIICPDGEVTPDIDKKRILWAAQDITENRPPLSRWHPDWKDQFAAFMQ
jgi:NAD(P)-dependent dehydrogenase (short-subunit alcohol dehydrogenase family)